MLYRFENIELDLATYKLRRDGKQIPLRKKNFDILCYLIAHRGRIVTQQELADNLWVGKDVNKSTIPWYICNLRKILCPKPNGLNPLATIHGRGYKSKSEIQIIEESQKKSDIYSINPTNNAGEPFLGREDVMQQMSDAIDKTIEGRGNILVLHGEEGIGKSRCVAEFCDQMSSRGIRVWKGRCSETPGQPAFWPWIQILRNATSDPSLEASVQIASKRLLSLFTQYRLPKTKSSAEDARQPTADSFWMYDRLHSFLSTCSSLEPRILIIDDIHLADDTSLEFLNFIAPDMARLKLLLVLTQEDDMDMEGRSVQAHRFLFYSEKIPLTRLSQDDVDQYISESGLMKTDKRMSRVFYTKTGGNPLFVREITRLLASISANSIKKLTADELHNLDIPDVIRDLLKRRLDTVDQQTRTVLDMASVIGIRFDLRLLVQTLDQKKGIVMAALDRAANAGLITKQSTMLFRFRYDFIRDVAYETLPWNTRIQYHNRIAETLLKSADSDVRMSEVAFHMAQAEPFQDINTVIDYEKKVAALSANVHAGDDVVTYHHGDWMA